MASRIEEFDEVILCHAKEEFLEKGFADASLRTIAQKGRGQYEYHLYKIFRQRRSVLLSCRRGSHKAAGVYFCILKQL